MTRKFEYPSIVPESLPQPAEARLDPVDFAQEEELDLGKYWKVIRKHLWGILGLAVSVTVLALLILLSMTPIYRATATLIIEPKQQKVVSVEELYGVDTGKAEYFQTQFEILKSRSLAKKVIQALNLAAHPEFNKPKEEGKESIGFDWRSWLPIKTPEPPVSSSVSADPIDGLTDAFLARLTIAPIRNTQLVKISFDAASPELAMRAANAVGQAYIDSNLDARSEGTKLASSWLAARLDGLRAKLAESEKRLHAYLEQERLVNVSGAVSGEGAQVSGVLALSANQLSEMTQRHIDARRARLEAETLYNQVVGLGDKLQDKIEAVPAVFNDPTVRDLKQQESESQAKLSELEQRYGAQHPERVAVESHLKAVRASLHKQITSVVNGLRHQLDAARANEAALSRQIDQVKGEIQGISRKEGQLKELEREVESNRNLYEMFFTRLRETSEAGDLQPSNARIVDPAPLPITPFKPNKKAGGAIAFVLALMAGIGLAFLIELMDKSFKGSVEEVERKLGLPLLGLIPLFKQRGAGQIDVPDIYLNDRTSMFAESVRTIRTGIMLSSLDNPHMNILVTSSTMGEGKSTVSLSLAMSIAQLSSKVLVIEADLRRPNLAKHCGLSPKMPGLSNLVAHTAAIEDCIHHFEAGNIDLMPAGVIPPNPLELISSRRFAEVIAELEEVYDAIIFDAPPLQPVSDALALSRLARSVIYVVQAEKTPVQVVRSGLDRLRKVRAPLTGVVLNQVDVDKGRRYYGEHYYGGYYYRYGQYTSESMDR